MTSMTIDQMFITNQNLFNFLVKVQANIRINPSNLISKSL